MRSASEVLDVALWMRPEWILARHITQLRAQAGAQAGA
jgi:hypothetical protein